MTAPSNSAAETTPSRAVVVSDARSLLRFSRTDESRIWVVAKPCKTVMVEVYDDGNVVLLVTDGEKTEIATIVEANVEVAHGFQPVERTDLIGAAVFSLEHETHNDPTETINANQATSPDVQNLFQNLRRSNSARGPEPCGESAR